VSVEIIVQTLMENAATARKVITQAVPQLAATRGCTCGCALQHAVITDPARFAPETRQRLALLLDKYFPPPPA
jgi:5'-methylthioadenosine phosphorylase